MLVIYLQVFWKIFVQNFIDNVFILVGHDEFPFFVFFS